MSNDEMKTLVELVDRTLALRDEAEAARVALLMEQQKNAEPRVVEVNRKAAVESLNAFVSVLLAKHAEVLVVWKEATDAYVRLARASPEMARKMTPPGDKPSEPAEVEAVRGHVRALEALVDEKFRIAPERWLSMFQAGTHGVSRMEAMASNYRTLGATYGNTP